MADSKISALNSWTPTWTDLWVMVQWGETKKFDIADLPISDSTQTALDGKTEEAPGDWSTYWRKDRGWAVIPWGWDMNKSTYDPTNVSWDAFDMDNMVEWITNKILTATDKTNLDDNTTHRTSNWSDHTFINQDVTTTWTPEFISTEYPTGQTPATNTDKLFQNSINNLQFWLANEFRLELWRTLSSKFLNNTGWEILKGKVIYVSWVDVWDVNFEVWVADNRTYNQNWVLWVAGNTTNDWGLVEFVQKWVVEWIDTTSVAVWNVLYLGENWAFTTSRPTYPWRAYIIWSTVYSDATNGVLWVNTETDPFNYTIEWTAVESQDLVIYVDWGIIYVDVEKDWGGDLPVQIWSKNYILDCATWAGIWGRARASLTAWTATVPVKNWIYVWLSGSIAVLQTATSAPTWTVAILGTVNVLDATITNTEKELTFRRFNNATVVDWQWIITTAINRIRELGWTTYESWLTPNLTIDTWPSPESVDFTIATWVVKQMFNQDVIAKTLSVDWAYIINDETTPYTKITDLNSIITDATWASLSNKYYQIVMWVSKNYDSWLNDKVYLLKPNWSYGNASDAFNDVDGLSNTSFPKWFDTPVLVCAFVLKYAAWWGWSFTNEALGFWVNFIDLRWVLPWGSASWSWAAAITDFNDANFTVFDNWDDTKKLAFELSWVTTGTTRTLTVPDKSWTIALLDDIPAETLINAQTWTTYTLVLTDQSKLVTLTNAAAITLTIPTNASVAFPIGTQVDLSQDGAWAVTVAGAWVTINSLDSNKTSNGQWVWLTLMKVWTDSWNLYGNLI